MQGPLKTGPLRFSVFQPRWTASSVLVRDSGK